MLSENETTCAICTDQFEDPRMLLECMHTFCRQCLHEWFNSLPERGGNPRRRLPCPVCRTEYDLTDDDIDQLPVKQLVTPDAAAVHDPQQHQPLNGQVNGASDNYSCFNFINIWVAMLLFDLYQFALYVLFNFQLPVDQRHSSAVKNRKNIA